jgi:plastocyanin
MSKSILAGALVAFALAAVPLVGRADSGHGGLEHGGPGGGHPGSALPAADLAGAWAALMAARDAIAADVESGALKDIHGKAEPLPELVDALLDRSRDLEEGKRMRVEGAAKQVGRVAEALHVAADGGDAERTRKELSRLDSLLELIRAQYPAGALDAGGHGHESHSAAPGHGHGMHAHAERPDGLVDAPPQVTIRVRALDPFRFEPKHMQIQAGVPTRIEFANAGAAEHSLVVKTPDGIGDWVHLHAAPGATEAATYQLDEPGTYPVLCTVPGHTEGGMIGELVVLVGHDGKASHH